MGTRSNTWIMENISDVNVASANIPIVNMYRQMDGYPTGHGRDLLEFLLPIKLVNGLSGASSVANGAGCLAAQMIAHFKTDAGGIYMMPAIEGFRYENDYTYEVHVLDLSMSIIVYEYENKIFEGTIREFGQFIKEEAA